MPTPEGVPVEMMVPGSSVMPEDSSSMMSAMEVISRSVVESYRSSPLTQAVICRAGGDDARAYGGKAVQTFAKVPLFVGGLQDTG